MCRGVRQGRPEFGDTIRHITIRDQQSPVQSRAIGAPDAKPVLVGVLGQRDRVPLRLRMFSGEHRDDACAIRECQAYRIGVAYIDRLIDTCLRRAQRLIRQTLEPKRAGQLHQRTDALINPIMRGVDPPPAWHGAADASLRAGSRARLVAEIMQRHCHHAVGRRYVRRVIAALGHLSEPLRQLGRGPVFTNEYLMQPQPVQRRN